MHKLARQIRFQIDPFGRNEYAGWNSYAARPITEGFGLYLALWVHLKSKLHADTGFVVNVSKIDAAVRQGVIPHFQRQFTEWFRQQHTPPMEAIYKLMQDTKEQLGPVFKTCCLWKLELELNPFRRVGIQWETDEMVIYTEKFEFAAMHKLWNDKFDEKTNFELFGKCANPAGHGHNYILEVSVNPPAGKSAWLEGFEKTVRDRFVDIVDHKNLNFDVPAFSRINPTVENLSKLAWKNLKAKLKPCKLVEVTVWENDRTYCRYSE
ncbi:MAG: 6-carboxytetrahydropterin synthase [Anaerohalosphaeraceae bacterium]